MVWWARAYVEDGGLSYDELLLFLCGGLREVM